MDFQASTILPGSWIFCSLFLKQVRHACWSNSSIHKCGWQRPFLPVILLDIFLLSSQGSVLDYSGWPTCKSVRCGPYRSPNWKSGWLIAGFSVVPSLPHVQVRQDFGPWGLSNTQFRYNKWSQKTQLVPCNLLFVTYVLHAYVLQLGFHFQKLMSIGTRIFVAQEGIFAYR